MATRRPLTRIGGKDSQLPVGDKLPGDIVPNQIAAQYRVITESGTFVAGFNGWLGIRTTGGHGSGAVVRGNGFATGASAAELVEKWVRVLAGDTFTIVIGAGGAAVSISVNGTANGNDGSDTTITGPGVNITAKGGRGALAGTALPLSGPRGGYGGSGGDLHMEGGPGGDVIAATTYGVAGAGAVNWLNQLPALVRGGHVNFAGATGLAGGAGVGGRAGDKIQSGNGSTAGGGYGGPAADTSSTSTAIGANALGERLPASPVTLVQSLATWGIDVFGGGGDRATNAGPGGGSSGNLGTANGLSGIFGGVGGTGGFAQAVTARSGIKGPGGSIHSTTGAVTSGAGDAGIAIFQLIKD